MSNLIERRAFLKALVASVIAVSVPLPIGFPEPERGKAYLMFENVLLDQFRNVVPNIEFYINMRIAYTGPYKLENFIAWKRITSPYDGEHYLT